MRIEKPRVLVVKGRINNAEHLGTICGGFGIQGTSEVVLVFPGNPTHHTLEGFSDWKSYKSGTGLAYLARDLENKLSIPTTGIPLVTKPITKPTQIPKLSKQSFVDIMRAMGYGLTVVLPVRDRLFIAGTRTGEYFDKGLIIKGKELELSFWGAQETTPNKHLANYYNAQWRLLLEFALGNITLQDLPDTWQTAYQAGIDQIAKDEAERKAEKPRQVALAHLSEAVAQGRQSAVIAPEPVLKQSLCEPGLSAVRFMELDPQQQLQPTDAKRKAKKEEDEQDEGEVSSAGVLSSGPVSSSSSAAGQPTAHVQGETQPTASSLASRLGAPVASRLLASDGGDDGAVEEAADLGDAPSVGPDSKAAQVAVPAPVRFRWTPWSIVDVDAKPPAGKTLHIVHDTAQYRARQAKKEQKAQGEAGGVQRESSPSLSSSSASAQPQLAQPKAVADKDSKSQATAAHEFFSSKVAVVADARCATKILLTPSGLTMVSVEGRKTAVEEVELAARLIPSTRALLMLNAQLSAAQPNKDADAAQNKEGDFQVIRAQVQSRAVIAGQMYNYFHSTLQAMVHAKLKRPDFNSSACASLTVPFFDAMGQAQVLMIAAPAPEGTVLMDDRLYTSQGSHSAQIERIRANTMVMRASSLVWKTYQQERGQPPVFDQELLSSLREKKNEVVMGKLSKLQRSAEPVALSWSQLLSAEELQQAQKLAQEAKMFTPVRAEDLPPRIPGIGGLFTEIPPLAQIIGEFKDLFTMTAKQLESLLEPVSMRVASDEKQGQPAAGQSSPGVVSTASAAGQSASMQQQAAESSSQALKINVVVSNPSNKNYFHWLNHYAVNGSAYQICLANLLLANVLLCQMKHRQEASKQGPSGQPMVLEITRCLELYEKVFVDIAENFAELQAGTKRRGFELLADLQIVGANIKAGIKLLFPSASLKDYAHRVHHFENLFKAVDTIVAVYPAVKQSIEARMSTSTALSASPVVESDNNQGPCLVM